MQPCRQGNSVLQPLRKPVRNAPTTLPAGRLRAAMVWAMMPLAFWTGAPFACCCGVGNCPALMAALMPHGEKPTGQCCPCCCHKNSSSGHRICGTQPASPPGKCNCPLMSRVPAVVAPTVALVVGSNHIAASIAPVALATISSLAAVRPGDRCETGPPIGVLDRSERLLI